MSVPTQQFIRSALPRFGRVPRDLLRAPGVPDRAVRLYGLLDDYAGVDDKVFPRRSVIAASMGCSVDSVDRAIAALEETGWLVIVPRYRDDGGQTTNLYVLTAGPEGGAAVVRPPRRTGAQGPAARVRPQEGEPLEGEQPPQPPKGGAGRLEGDPTLIPVADVGGVRDTGNMDKPPATPTRRREVSDDDPAWSAWWAAYPRKTSKGAARKAWVKALAKVESADVLIEGAKRVAADLAYRKKNPRPGDRGTDPTSFVPYPATWLNREQWMDQDEAGKKQNDGRLAPPKKHEECPIHVGQWASNCRGCAADAKARPDPD